jgi:hypothetical protein
MDILAFAQAIYQKSLTLLKYHRGGTPGDYQYIVLVQKENGEKVCWYWNSGFNSGVYGDEAEKSFNERVRRSQP